mgnify:FL=1
MTNPKKMSMDALPPCPKRLPVPDHADMATEEGTTYHIRSFLSGIRGYAVCWTLDISNDLTGFVFVDIPSKEEQA